jgi:hypothetical protein
LTWKGGFGIIAPGKCLRCWFTLDGGDDKGAQFIMAHPFYNEPFGAGVGIPAELTVSDFTKAINLDGSVAYAVTVCNTGSSIASFELQGGGLT